jgi:hypothetical protein
VNALTFCGNKITVQALGLTVPRAVLDAYQAYAKHPAARFLQVYAAAEPGQLADAIAPLLQLSIGVEKAQQLLETDDVVKRLEMILELIEASRQAA